MRLYLVIVSILLVPLLQGVEAEPLLYFEWADSYYWVEAPVFRDGAAVPVLALYDSGFLVYFTEDRRGHRTGVEAVRLTASELERFLSEFQEAGFNELRPHSERWFRGALITDQRTSVIRLRRAGELIEKKNYGDWSETPDALRRSREFLSSYDHPRATPYRSDGATLTLRRLDPESVRQPLDGHLLPESLQPPCEEAETWRVGLRGQNLRALELLLGRNAGLVHVRYGTRFYSLRLEPWLPGESAEVEFVVLEPENACTGPRQEERAA